MTLEFELLRTRDQILAIRQEWEALWARSHGDYYLSFVSCLLSWDTTHAPQARSLTCAVARDNGAIVAILPMSTKRRRLWTFAIMLGPEAAEGCDVLQANDAPAALGQALVRFYMRASGADVLDLPFVRAGNVLDQAVLAVPNFHAVTYSDVMPYARLDGEESWESFEASLGRRVKADTARQRRRMAELGTMRFEVREGEADAAIDWMLDEKAKWGRKVEKLGGWLFSRRYRDYLKTLAATSKRVLTFVYTLDDRPVAVKVVFVAPTLCTLIIAAYDDSLNRFSPGNILDEVWMKHVFDHCCAPDGRRLDVCFGNGVERYKLYWGRGFTYGSHTYKLAATRWGALPYRLKAVRQGLARVIDMARPRHGATAEAAE
jgi:CelD/BcsL family acetyltransferase involved in cellulose biosynthesis